VPLDLLLVPGGIGLFLIGMSMLTEGLRTLAGPDLRRRLQEAARTPLRGALAGGLATAIIQSSSAVTVATVGFVGAALLTFPQAVGIVLGANVGTTVTGWIVAAVGFRLDVGLLVLPLLLAGALMHRFGSGRLAAAGAGLAGFSLVFVGIDQLKDGMSGLAAQIGPGLLPGEGPGGRLPLILIGLVLAVLTQSSSAGVAMALAALDAGTIGFGQAAAMVIGMDIGTTATGLLAALGGSAAMRRTAWAHVIYNLVTAVLATLVVLPLVLAFLPDAGRAGRQDAEFALVAFHTGFNLAGAVLILPFAGSFARLVERLVPERGPALTRRLDRALLAEPAVAAEAGRGAVRDLLAALAGEVGRALDPAHPPRVPQARLTAIEAAIDSLRAYSQAIPGGPPGVQADRAALFHAADHLGRLADRAGQDVRLATLRETPDLARPRRLFARALAAPRPDAEALRRLAAILRRQHERYRDRTLRAAAADRIGPETAAARLDAARWLYRSAYHLWRIALWLGGGAVLSLAEARHEADEG
jgi:phosphate:Na+ symporter